MKLNFQSKGKVIFEKNGVMNHKNEFSKFGKCAFIVTGKNSGHGSGALTDVKNVLDELSIKYFVFDAIENNPSFENVKAASDSAREFSPDFIVGIGGGSPLDAAKAVALLATNDIEPIALYGGNFEHDSLPIIAIPTTAGSGSEVTPYAILTREDMTTKKSFSNDDVIPKIAFLDARYTKSMSTEMATNSALDAFSHALEGYLNKKSTVISDIFALEVFRIFGECLPFICDSDFNDECREKLLYASFLGGVVITHTGTTSVHSLGYSLTYFKGVQHGKANGLLLAEYLRKVYPSASTKIDKVLSLINVKDIDSFKKLLKTLLPYENEITDEEFERYASITISQKKDADLTSLNQDDLVDIFRNSMR